ncbi:RluA family pseudouridine synthase [Simkania sp.]|uniref:RluA family pseudouridine synthase n=1 Tax=Simkania sp. TaxID=34094 RepID=UPI003B52C018
MKFPISARDSGKTILSFLKEKLELSGQVLKRAVDQGAVRLNGVVERFSSVKLEKGDFLELNRSKLKEKQEFTLPILLEEEGFLICSKPSGLVTDPEVFKKLLGRSVFLVHRLDKDTSGVILVATNQKMQKKLEALFKKREVRKVYVALVKGVIRQESGTIDNRLMKKKTYQGQAIWGSTKNPKGLRAITHWKCVGKGKGRSLVQCEPETGRTHQLRVHFSEMGHTILGDHHYGREAKFPAEIDRLCLHAYRLIFQHPVTGEKVQATAPIPKLFKI